MFIGFITKFIPPQFYVLALLGYGLVSAFAGGWVVQKFHQASELSELKRIQEKSAEERKEALELSKLLELRLANEKAKRIAIEGKLRDELKSPAYNCVVPLSGVQLLRDAVGSPSG